jgi:site-specific recombinase XerD
VDLEQRNITVEADTAKGAKTRHIRLNDEAVKVLRTWRDQPGAKSLIYVFSNNDGQPLANVRKSWVGILKRAGIENFRWHDLRHTFASNLVIAGVDLNKVRALLGHTDYKMTLRYAHLAPEHMQEAVDKLVTPAVMVAR